MTRQQAQQRATELNQTVPDGADHRWIVRHADGQEWEVARLRIAGVRLPSEGQPRHGARGPEPAEPADPRPTITRLIPPVGPPGL